MSSGVTGSGIMGCIIRGSGMRLLAGVGVEELGNKVSKFGGNLPGSRVGRVKDPGYKVQESGKAGSRILPPVASAVSR